MQAAEQARPVIDYKDKIETMFDAYYPMVFGVAYRVTGRAADAEDVLQTVFMRLLQRDGTEEGAFPDNPRAYLHRSAINASLDVVRKRRRFSVVPLEEVPPIKAKGEGAGEIDPADRERLHDALRRGMLELSPLESEAFALKYFEDYSAGEIAETLGTTSNSINVTLHSARKKLQHVLKPFVEVTS